MDSLVTTLLGSLGRLDLATFGLMFARLLPIVAMTPLFGGAGTPRRLRLGASLALAALLYPAVQEASAAEQASTSLTMSIALEGLLGLCVAVVTNAFFDLFASVGSLVDLARGASFATVFDPLAQAQAPALELFLRVLLVAVFLSMGLHRELIVALCHGFHELPPGTVSTANIDARATLALVNDLATLAVRIALPFLIGMLLLDLSLALIQRAAGRLEIHVIGTSAKALAGLALLVALLPMLVRVWIDGGFASLLGFAGGE